MVTAALVVAAGRGERLRSDLPKAFVPLAGRALVVHALGALASCPEIDGIVPVVAAADRERFVALRPELASLPHAHKIRPPVAGGRERQDSVRAGVAALPREVEWVAVHDAARPLVRPEDVARVLAVARRCGAALLAAPLGDTLKRVRSGRIVETLSRGECWAAQTPQVFRLELLREALEKAEAEGFVGTDDAQLVERLGVAVEVIEGDASNCKITWPQDLAAAAAELAVRRSG